MINTIDYMYFRIYSFYRSRQDVVPKFTAKLIMALSFGFFLSDFIFLFQSFTGIKMKKQMIIVIMISLLIMGFLWLECRYRNVEVRQIISETKLAKNIRGFIIVAFIAISILTPMVLGYLEHNLGYNLNVFE